MKLRAAIFGGSGYGGSELLRILLFHPNVEIVLVTANEQAGKKVGDVHRNLLRLTDLVFQTAPSDVGEVNNIDVASVNCNVRTMAVAPLAGAPISNNWKPSTLSTIVPFPVSPLIVNWAVLVACFLRDSFVMLRC